MEAEADMVRQRMTDLNLIISDQAEELRGAQQARHAAEQAQDVLKEEIRVLRNHGSREPYHYHTIGMNSRLDELQAALLLVRLEWLEQFTRRRQKIAASYQAGLDNPLIQLLQPPVNPENHVYHLFVVTCDQRERLSGFLADRGVASLIHYPVPVHHQLPCRDIRRDPQGLEAAERHAGRCLSIPCHPQMSDADVAHVTQAVNDFC
jgi:dTDP-4-amino-4,6-dideoxygalactose transaminase